MKRTAWQSTFRALSMVCVLAPLGCAPGSSLPSSQEGAEKGSSAIVPGQAASWSGACAMEDGQCLRSVQDFFGSKDIWIPKADGQGLTKTCTSADGACNEAVALGPKIEYVVLWVSRNRQSELLIIANELLDKIAICGIIAISFPY